METFIIQESTTGKTESSYPTYEEWKPLNVNELDVAPTVLILPMRNGNFDKIAVAYDPVAFLSYLWGMETS